MPAKSEMSGVMCATVRDTSTSSDCGVARANGALRASNGLVDL
jgi:hypothetical protein